MNNKFSARLRKLKVVPTAKHEVGHDYVFKYGAYARMTVEEAIKEHPGYCTWMQEQGKMTFTQSVLIQDKEAKISHVHYREERFMDTFDYMSRHHEQIDPV